MLKKDKVPNRGKYKLKSASSMLKAKILSPQYDRMLVTWGDAKTHNSVKII